MRRDVFQGIADPTRREILALVSKKRMNLNAVAAHFDISRPAISKHIKLLTECGLVVIKQEGRERYCEPHLEKLNQVSRWIEQYRLFWTDRLQALDQHLSNTKKRTPASKHKKK